MKKNIIKKETKNNDFDEAVKRIRAIEKMKDRDGTLILVVDKNEWMNISNISSEKFKEFVEEYLYLLSLEIYN